MPCWVVHERTDLLGTAAPYVQLLGLGAGCEIPHAQLFVPLRSFTSLCEHAGAVDGAGFQSNKAVRLWFLLQPKEEDVIRAHSTVWL